MNTEIYKISESTAAKDLESLVKLGDFKRAVDHDSKGYRYFKA